jgi:hypothetical protein
MYLSDNRSIFPVVPDIAGGTSNKGRVWVGKKGTAPEYAVYDVTDRPLNRYLGCQKDGEEVPVAHCHISKLNNYTKKGTSYFGAARQNKKSKYGIDLDGGTESDGTVVPYIAMTSVQTPTQMAFVFETPAYVYATGKYPGAWDMVHHPGQPFYPVSFVDGHAKLQKIRINSYDSASADVKFKIRPFPYP